MTTIKVECIGGPRDGEVVEVDAQSTTVRFPDITGGHHVYELVRRRGDLVLLYEWRATR